MGASWVVRKIASFLTDCEFEKLGCKNKCTAVMEGRGVVGSTFD